ncbi:OstA-like protein precursor [Chondrocystis sp. NIES-4102]|nr:OstA-like protein precursor [Chondrocystis sp. NIES-4102]
MLARFFVRNAWVQIAKISICSAIALASIPLSIQAQSALGSGAITLKSDIQESNSKTGIITARGNVQINYPARKIQATAAQAQYYSRERRLILTGNVYVIQEGNSMRAETLTYLVDEGRFIATPQSDRQVESTYIIIDN